MIRNIFQSISFPVKKMSITTKQEHTELVNNHFPGFDNDAIYLKATALWLKTKSNTLPTQGKRMGGNKEDNWDSFAPPGCSLKTEISISTSKCN